MSELHKRSADDAGVSRHGPSKMPRMTDVLTALDIRVVNRLDDLVAAGLIAQDELDAKALAELSEFEPQDALVVLEQFQHSGLENVRNKSAYLHGVMIRFRKDTGPRLDREVHSRLTRLYRTSKVKASDLDARVFEVMGSLPPPIAIRAIDRFQSKVTDDVRNVAAFFTSILRQEHASLGQGGSAQGSGGYHEPDHGHRERTFRREYDAHGEPEQFDLYPPGGMRQPLPPPPIHQAPRQISQQSMLLPQGGNSMAAPAQNTTPQIVILSPDQLQQLQQLQQPGAVNLQSLLPQLVAAIQQQQQQLPIAQPVLASVPSYAQPAMIGGKKSYAAEHASLGVRVAEFHNLSHFSEFVHPAPALKLQQLWDGGNRLVSLLDDRTWEVLSELGAPEALAVVDQVADNMVKQDLRNPNAFFMSCAKRYLEKNKGAADVHASIRGSHHQGPHSSQATYNSRNAQQQQPGGREYGRPAGVRGGSSGSAALDSLPEGLQQLARQAIVQHHPAISEATFDEGVVDYMKRLSQEDAQSVFEELMNADVSNVRNTSAYLMGMIRKRRQDANAGRSYNR